MSPIHQWFSLNSDLVTLIYGLSIAAIGAAILFQPKRESRFPLAGTLWLFAGYAFLHAPADFIHLRAITGGVPETVIYVGKALTFSSYVFLFEFGRRAVGLSKPTAGPWLLPLVLIGIVVMGVFSGDFWAVENVLFGYLVRFPAGIMAAGGLYWFYQANRKTLKPLKVKKHFIAASLALFFWAFLCGIVRVDAHFFPSNWLNIESFFLVVGVPVYVFRTICAVVVVWGVTGILRIFNWETMTELRNARDNLKLELTERSRVEDKLREQRELLEQTVEERTTELQHNFEIQTVLNALLNISMKRRSLETTLRRSLEVITAIPWLGLESRASIALVDGESECLKLAAHVGFSEIQKEKCGRVRFGQCLCGLAAADQEIVFSDSVDDRHHIKFEGIADHSDYCVPIVFSGKTVGVIAIHSKPGNQSVKPEKDFLLAVGNVLAGIIARGIAEEKLVTYWDQLRSLASELVLAEERERRRIATDLHDRIGQNLATVKMKLGQACADVSDSSLVEVQHLLEQIISDTRSLTFELSPPILYELGLEPALEWLVERVHLRHGIRGSCLDDGEHKPLRDDVRVLLFRATRELVNNVVRHARAENLTISIAKEENHVRIDIEDDGVGFDSQNATDLSTGDSTHFGLFSVKERMDQLRGRLELTSTPGQGTKATLVAPLELPTPSS